MAQRNPMIPLLLVVEIVEDEEGEKIKKGYCPFSYTSVFVYRVITPRKYYTGKKLFDDQAASSEDALLYYYNVVVTATCCILYLITWLSHGILRPLQNYMKPFSCPINMA